MKQFILYRGERGAKLSFCDASLVLSPLAQMLKTNIFRTARFTLSLLQRRHRKRAHKGRHFLPVYISTHRLNVGKYSVHPNAREMIVSKTEISLPVDDSKHLIKLVYKLLSTDFTLSHLLEAIEHSLQATSAGLGRMGNNLLLCK